MKLWWNRLKSRLWKEKICQKQKASENLILPEWFIKVVTSAPEPYKLNQWRVISTEKKIVVKSVTMRYIRAADGKWYDANGVEEKK